VDAEVVLLSRESHLGRDIASKLLLSQHRQDVLALHDPSLPSHLRNMT
jgi:hypothetical protein